MGEEPALGFFEVEAKGQGKAGYLPAATPDFMAALERQLSGSVGAATAHAMISQLFGRATVTVEDLMAVANETVQIMEYSARLESQQAELSRSARKLHELNEKLTQHTVQKMANPGGAIAYLPGQGGVTFRITLPLGREKLRARAALSTLW